MATRTVQFLGLAYGSSPASITATANGTQIFTGPVTTADQPVASMPNLALINTQEILFTMEIDTSFSGNIPMTCTVNSGTVIFGMVLANYSNMTNPVYTQEQLDVLNNPSSTRAQKAAVWTAVANPPFTAEEIAILEDPSTPSSEIITLIDGHGCAEVINSGPSQYREIDNTDPRSSVAIDGVAQTPDHGELPGTWWWTIASGSTLAYNLDVDPVVA